MLCDEVETARGFTYLGGGCLAAVAARHPPPRHVMQ